MFMAPPFGSGHPLYLFCPKNLDLIDVNAGAAKDAVPTPGAIGHSENTYIIKKLLD